MAYQSKHTGTAIDAGIDINDIQNTRLTALENVDINILNRLTALENIDILNRLTTLENTDIEILKQINDILNILQGKPNLEILTTNNLNLLRTVVAGTSNDSGYSLQDVVGGKRIFVSVSYSGSTHIITLTPKFNLDGYKKCTISGTFGHNLNSALTTTIHAQFSGTQITTDSGSWCMLGTTTSQNGSFSATYDISNFTGDNYLNFRCYHGTQTDAYTCHFYITSILLTN